jgi:2-aminoethylphosphonate-pyruvate transaminase
MNLILLNPGPVNLSERVRQALLGPDLCHREPEFLEMQRRVREGLLAVYELPCAQWAAVMLAGSGTAAMEAMVTSLVPRGGGLLVVENGVYGERLGRIAAAHGITCERLIHTWDAAIDLGALAAGLTAHPDIGYLAVVQHETTTGRLNDLEAVAALCRQHGVQMLIDGVSSFGAESIDFTLWPIAAVAASANKCLHGVPGLAFVIVNRAAMVAACQPPRSVYLDLSEYLARQDALGTPFTPAVPTFYALEAALQELAEAGGWRARQARYRRLAEAVRAGLADLGIGEYLPATESSCVLRAYHLPRGMDYDTLHDALKARGFVIYAGQGGLSDHMFRISTLGTVDDADVSRLLAAFHGLIN